ncbi:hypothetical protein B1207_01075 [Legionella quinlivanii]|uniref:DUF4935 domain-containing protein n=1 Tax=Legionella quinlivanii TaxID=45073 RepID=A0A364LN77_9GAMM|nr:PIN domain-containing protein [Legionella quinlivanii]RAP38509.1 hypothetical protein B1207_01075 [Legionella quinlivanii]
MDVFIDTNILTSLYRLSKEDLESFKKIYVLLEKKEINILLTEQVRNEFFRIRDDIIYDAITKFKEQSLKLSVPAIFKADSEYQTLLDLKDSYNKHHQKILKKIEKENRDNSFKADEIVQHIVEKSKCLEVTDDILSKAKRRKELGNPPGKKNSLGDQINWEILLLNDNKLNDLYLISADGDFFYKNTNIIKSFLKEEWERSKATKIFGYRTLSDFFTDKHPNIKLASELNQELLINRLVNSSSFSETHQAIYNLRAIEAYTPPQIDLITDAFLQNNQLNWIATDPDVSEFISMLIHQYNDQISDDKLNDLSDLISSDDDYEDEYNNN